MKRVAVCISGQSRTWEHCIDNIQYFFKNTDEYQFDYFIHTWDINTYPEPTSHKYPNVRIKYSYDSNQMEYINRYSPKLYKIQSFKKYEDSKKIKITDNDIPSTRHLFYSFKQSIILKKIWERKNNFKYDYVVKIRPDIFFINQSIKFHIESLENSPQKSFVSYFSYSDNWKEQLNNYFGADLYWLFKNENVDEFASYYSEKNKFEKKLNIIYTQYRHTFNYNFNPINLKDYAIVILRPYHIPFIKNLYSESIVSELKLLEYMFINSNLSPDKQFLDFVYENNLIDDLNKSDIISFIKNNVNLKHFIEEYLNKMINNKN